MAAVLRMSALAAVCTESVLSWTKRKWITTNTNIRRFCCFHRVSLYADSYIYRTVSQ